MPRQNSPFLRLPTEIRLMIYEELLLPPASNEPCPPNTKFVAPIYREDEPNGSTASHQHHLRAPRTLQIRTLNPDQLPSVLPANFSRPRYHIRDALRTRTLTTTYALANNPGLHPAILATCRQCHAEGAELLYGAYAFDFDTHIEAIAPFFSALTPLARSFVSRIAIVKRPLTLCKEFDRAEWKTAFGYMARELNLPALTLSLGVVAGKPPAGGSAGDGGSGAGGWEDVPALTVEHFRLVQPRSLRSRPPSGTATPTGDAAAAGALEEVRKAFDGDLLYGLGLKAIAGVDFEWVEQLLWLRGLRDIHVRAIVEHCPTPMSETMAFWVSFSKSVEGGFREWLRGVMLA